MALFNQRHSYHQTYLRKTRKPTFYAIRTIYKHNLCLVQKIYTKSHSPDKTEPQWNGPFVIDKISPKGNWVVVMTDKGMKTASVHNIRRGAECGNINHMSKMSRYFRNSKVNNFMIPSKKGKIKATK